MAAWAATDNVKVNGTVSLTSTNTKTVNSVYLTGNGILDTKTNAQNLVITNGGVIATGGNISYTVNGNISLNNALVLGGTPLMPAMATPSRTRQLKPAPACRTWFSTSPAITKACKDNMSTETARCRSTL